MEKREHDEAGEVHDEGTDQARIAQRKSTRDQKHDGSEGGPCPGLGERTAKEGNERRAGTSRVSDEIVCPSLAQCNERPKTEDQRKSRGEGFRHALHLPSLTEVQRGRNTRSPSQKRVIKLKLNALYFVPRPQAFVPPQRQSSRTGFPTRIFDVR